MSTRPVAPAAILVFRQSFELCVTEPDIVHGHLEILTTKLGDLKVRCDFFSLFPLVPAWGVYVVDSIRDRDSFFWMSVRDESAAGSVFSSGGPHAPRSWCTGVVVGRPEVRRRRGFGDDLGVCAASKRRLVAFDISRSALSALKCLLRPDSSWFLSIDNLHPNDSFSAMLHRRGVPRDPNTSFLVFPVALDIF
ncbi:hypothetical protein C8R45DRAFT_195595 [Mycena sanguinolenta]|nr:hypothetical protein C8R45DRAFT_195595 [Mycena sanguinolenta]